MKLRPSNPYISFVLFVTALVGCGTAPTKKETRSGDGLHASVVAVDPGLFDLPTGEEATTRILAINGVSTGSSRFDPGSSSVPPGTVHLRLRLWGENKRMSFPMGSPTGKIETFACVSFEVLPKRNYEVSSKASENFYVITVTDVTDSKKETIDYFRIPFIGYKAPITCY